ASTFDIYPLSLHDALPIWKADGLSSGHGFSAALSMLGWLVRWVVVLLACPHLVTQPTMAQSNSAAAYTWATFAGRARFGSADGRSEEHTSELQSRVDLVCR